MTKAYRNKETCGTIGGPRIQDSKFRKLNMKAEEKKINLFYLKDLLLKDSTPLLEKQEALDKIKRNMDLPVFALAMKTLLSDIDKIKETFIQKEIINQMGKCKYKLLVGCLQEYLARKDIEEEMRDEAEEALSYLKVATRIGKEVLK